MGYSGNDMDGFLIHLAPVPRRFPAAVRVGSVGHLPHKTARVDHGFPSWNFSFVLSGSGDYAVDHRSWALQPPCVITQRPGHHYRYGPPAGGWWEELFMIYPPDQAAALEATGLMAPQRHWWPVGRSGRLHPLLRELAALVAEDGIHHVDRIDRVCERLVLESLLEAHRDEPSPSEAAVDAIRHRVEMDPLHDHDFDALAREHDLSPTHFRRLWNRAVGTPPARYRSELLLRRACHDLVETARPVAAIAADLGFSDPLYFSRRFRHIVGDSPTGYRRRYAGSASLSYL